VNKLLIIELCGIIKQNKMDKKLIAVVGATGHQGRSVVNALKKNGSYLVRAITRNPDKYQGQADEVVKGDLTDLELLTNAFKDAHGVFVVTNFGKVQMNWLREKPQFRQQKIQG
jgi:uncharacterized protein YbjT (DUF2867 family)